MSNPYDEAETLSRVDRSTLEAYAECPLSARLSEGSSPTFAMISGNEVHHAISQVIMEWIDDPTMSRSEMADKIRSQLNYSRPDVQPDVVRGGSRAAWEIAGLFAPLSPLHVLRYDGGTGKRSGQLSHQLGTLPLIVTCEVDLLLATASKQQVIMLDWKSGWKQWSASAVADSFQFQFYAAMVLHNYPDVLSVLTKILNTRTNTWTYEIEFTRSDLDRYMGRINTTAAEWWKHRESATENVPAWPGREKCERCRVAQMCPKGDFVYVSNPIESVREFHALKAKVAEWEAILEKHVRDTGADIETPDGLRFGFNKPKRTTKPKSALYSVKTTGETDEVSDAST